MSETAGYRHRGAEALVLLHARHLRAFVRAWQAARAEGLTLPASRDAHCAALEPLLRHVLGAATGYMKWFCRCLELPDPGLAEVPDDVATDPETYLEHVLERWDLPLRGLDEDTAETAVFQSSWGVAYCIDGMLEHAVMHPIRHQFQLERARTARA